MTGDDIRKIIEDGNALTAMHLAIEDELIEWRDAGRFELFRANGFTVNYKDGSPAHGVRIGTRIGLMIALTGLAAYLDEIGKESDDD